jgi:predicted metal-dependent peptidase
MAGRRGSGARQQRPGAENLLRGHQILAAHTGFRHIGLGRVCARTDCPDAPRHGLLAVDSSGALHVNMWARADPEAWAWAIAHARLHLGLGHIPAERTPGPEPDAALRAARCAVVNRFLRGFKVGEPPFDPPGWPEGDEEAIAATWRVLGVPEEFEGRGTAGDDAPDHWQSPHTASADPVDWRTRFAAELTAAVAASIVTASGREAMERKRVWDAALEWFVSSFPLLGAIAARMRIVADVELARASRISVAAVDAARGEIYVNPRAGLTADGWRFVLAHEMLHAALRHADRVGGRDPYLWNVACDYVINGWLLELGVGVMPGGLLHDPQLAGLSAEQVYDRIAKDLRRLRKLATLRGQGLGDVLTEPLPRAGEAVTAVDLDEFYRKALIEGRVHHVARRGLLPAGLDQEIRALEHPPPPWDVRLARWFDEHVSAEQPRRSYARPSRRQSSSPDIPRPGRVVPTETVPKHTFGVVLDTSASMSSRLLGKALGAIASYALARDVPVARIVYCDAAAYDAGYLPVEQIAVRARVRGRGGTALQPAIDLLLHTQDFPPEAPILIITDGECEPLTVHRREHAYLMPRGARLPFTPRGEVFDVR